MILKLLLIIGITLFMYRRVFDYGLCIDDQAVAWRSKGKQTKNKWWDWWLQVRGLMLFSTKFCHAVGISFHILNACLIYLVFGVNTVSFFAALFFALNPINTQGSAWISGKPYVISAFLVLVGWGIKYLFPLSYLGAIEFGTSALAAPLLFLFYQPHWLLLSLPICLYLSRKRHKHGLGQRMAIATPIMNKIYLKKFIVSFKTYGYYFVHCLFPVRVGFFHSYLATFGHFTEESRPHLKPDRYMWIGIGLACATVTAMFFKHLPVSLGLIWFSIFITQWLNIVMISHCITERYVYLANVGLMYGLASLVMALPYPYNLVAGGMIAMGYAVKLKEVLPLYKDNIAMMASNIRVFPEAAEGYNEYGRELAYTGHVNTCIEVMMDGLKQRPHDFKLNYNLAELYTQIGEFEMGGMYAAKAWDALDEHAFVEGNDWCIKVQKLKDKCGEEIRKKALIWNIKIPKVREHNGVYTG